MKIAQVINLPGNFAIYGPPDFKFKDSNLAGVVSQTLTYIFPIAGVILFIYLVWGGFDYLISMGDSKKAESGKTKITHALIGFFIIFAAHWIVQIVDYVFKLGVYT